jgi:hypothetical protein
MFLVKYKKILEFYLVDLRTYKFVPFEPFGRSY